MTGVRISIVIIFCISNINAQISEKDLHHKIDSLLNIRNSVDQQIKYYEEELRSAELDRIISDQEKNGVRYYNAKLKMEATLKSEPSPFGKSLIVIPRGTIVEISVDPNSDFLLGKYNGSLGYLNNAYFEELPKEISILQKQAKEKRIKEKSSEWKKRQEELDLENERKARQRQIKKEQSDRERLKRLEQEWGALIARKIMNRDIWIGMTSDMARESLGTPEDINRTVNPFGTHEQWVYGVRGKKYLYFDNGILTSWQE